MMGTSRWVSWDRTQGTRESDEREERDRREAVEGNRRIGEPDRSECVATGCCTPGRRGEPDVDHDAGDEDQAPHW